MAATPLSPVPAEEITTRSHEGPGYICYFSQHLQTGVHMETTSTPAFSAATMSSSRDHSAITYGPNSTAVNPSKFIIGLNFLMPKLRLERF